MDDFCFASGANHLRVVQKVLFSLYPRTEVLGCGKVLGYGPRLGVLIKSRVVWVNPELKPEVAYILDAHLSFRSPGLQSGLENLPAFRRATHFNQKPRTSVRG